MNREKYERNEIVFAITSVFLTLLIDFIITQILGNRISTLLVLIITVPIAVFVLKRGLFVITFRRVRRFADFFNIGEDSHISKKDERDIDILTATVITAYFIQDIISLVNSGDWVFNFVLYTLASILLFFMTLEVSERISII